MSEINVSINAKVFCTDGECGHVNAVLINPLSKRVTHLIVRESGIFGQEKMIPLEAIKDSQPEKINLRIDEEKFHKMQDFLSIKYVSGDSPFGAYLPEHYYLHPFVMPDYDSEYDYNSYYVNVENIPAGELVIDRGEDVYALDGRVGKVDELLFSPKDDKITHIVLREGHLWEKKHVAIPISAVDRIMVDGVHLSLTKMEISELPTIPIRHPWMKSENIEFD